MNIINKLVLEQSDEPLDIEVFTKIINTLLPNRESILELSSSMKSTLFRLLLNYDKKNDKQMVKSFLVQVLSETDTSYRQEDLKDLKQMYVNSVEDSYLSKSANSKKNENFQLDMERSIKFLIELRNLNQINSQGDQLDKLNAIAKIRFIVTTLALCLNVHDNARTKTKLEVKFISDAKFFFTNTTTSRWPTFFLIKYVFRRYGNGVLAKAKESEYFSWILPGDTDQVRKQLVG